MVFAQLAERRVLITNHPGSFGWAVAVAPATEAPIQSDR
jgi:hypothetical protein